MDSGFASHPTQVFSHDIATGILVFHNNELRVMLVYQMNPVGVALM